MTIHHRRHQCPTCICADPERLVVNEAAPFYALVLEVDRIIYDEQRRPGRCANREAAA